MKEKKLKRTVCVLILHPREIPVVQIMWAQAAVRQRKPKKNSEFIKVLSKKKMNANVLGMRAGISSK